MQIICTSLQTDNHSSTSPLSFYRSDALPAAQPTASKHWRHYFYIFFLLFWPISDHILVSTYSITARWWTWWLSIAGWRADGSAQKVHSCWDGTSADGTQSVQGATDGAAGGRAVDRDDTRVSRTSGSVPRHLGCPYWPWQEKVEHLEFVSLLLIHLLLIHTLYIWCVSTFIVVSLKCVVRFVCVCVLFVQWTNVYNSMKLHVDSQMSAVV